MKKNLNLLAITLSIGCILFSIYNLVKDPNDIFWYFIIGVNVFSIILSSKNLDKL